MIDPSMPKIYGLDTIDTSKNILVVEGPIDSMFLENCVASCGSDITSNLSHIHTDVTSFTVVYDNEPRSPHTVRKMMAAVKHGFPVCIWPESIKFKDVNDMVIGGYSTADIESVISSNTYEGLSAVARISEWRKCGQLSS